MTLFKLNNLVLSGLICLSSLPAIAQRDLMDYENSLKFARYLNNTRQYSFATGEYERLNFLWPEDSAVQLELVRTYRLNHDCEHFLNSYNLISKNNRLFLYPSYAREYLRFCLGCKIEHPKFFSVSNSLAPSEEAFYILGYYWVNEKHDSAFIYNRSNAGLLAGTTPRLHQLTTAFEEQKYKKPILALFMSAVIPGSGKAYSKRWADASFSLILVGTSAFASYRAFRKKGVSSFNGWIFGGIAVSFYSSNIYGSFKAAKKYNEDLRLQYQKDAEGIIYNSF